MFNTSEKSELHAHRAPAWTLLGAALASAVALAALPAAAQGTGGTGTGSGGTSASGSAGSGTSASGAPGVTSSGSPRAAGNSASGTGSMFSRDDSRMMVDIAHANLAEIDTGKLALEKSQSDTVKKFAQQMIDDHTAALKELQTLAQSKGVKLPDSPDMKHKTMATALRAMSGTSFDNQYMKRSGIDDHQATLTLLKKVQANAKDADLKAMAGKMLPTVQHHLQMAQQSAPAAAKK